MKQYWIAYDKPSHEDETYSEYLYCIGNFSLLKLAKTVAKEKIQNGFKNVSIFYYDGNPYDKVMTRMVDRNLVEKYRIDI